MQGVPRWFRTLSAVLAIVFSVWLGLHYRLPHAAAWVAIYGAIALVTSVIPSHRAIGLAGLMVGVVVMAAGAYLMKGAGTAIAIHDVWSAKGGIVSASREAAALVIATAWLMIGSGFRLLRV